jgi:ABC-type Fe3+/spermidine/putrescine transport system ATPase subunit
VTIRPEEVVVEPAGGGCFPGTVAECRYAGTHGRLIIQLPTTDGDSWRCTATVPVATLARFGRGSTVGVHLPAAALWLMPER